MPQIQTKALVPMRSVASLKALSVYEMALKESSGVELSGSASESSKADLSNMIWGRIGVANRAVVDDPAVRVTVRRGGAEPDEFKARED